MHMWRKMMSVSKGKWKQIISDFYTEFKWFFLCHDMCKAAQSCVCVDGTSLLWMWLQTVLALVVSSLLWMWLQTVLALVVSSLLWMWLQTVLALVISWTVVYELVIIYRLIRRSTQDAHEVVWHGSVAAPWIDTTTTSGRIQGDCDYWLLMRLLNCPPTDVYFILVIASLRFTSHEVTKVISAKVKVIWCH